MPHHARYSSVALSYWVTKYLALFAWMNLRSSSKMGYSKDLRMASEFEASSNFTALMDSKSSSISNSIISLKLWIIDLQMILGYSL